MSLPQYSGPQDDEPDSEQGDAFEEESGVAAGDLSDRTLVEAALAGNGSARATIFDRHATRIHGLATKLVGSPDTARDLLQDTFLYAFERLKSLRNPDALASWLSQIVVRKALSHLRRQRRRKFVGLSVEMANDQGARSVVLQSPGQESAFQLSDARRLLERMSPEVRVVWWLQRVEGHTMNEVAMLTGLTIDQVKKRLRAGEEMLATFRAKELS